MKKSILIVMAYLCCSPGAYAGFSLGITGAVKKQVQKLNDKITGASNTASQNNCGGTGLGQVKWCYSADQAIYYSSPAIGPDGTIYLGGTQNLFALNPNGSLKWKYTIGTSVYSPVVGAGGVIYVQDNTSSLYALNPDGSLRWKYTLASSGAIGLTTPAVGADGTIYICGTYIYAINPAGTLNWSYNPSSSGAIRSSPSIDVDGNVYVGVNTAGGPRLVAVNSSGTLKWTSPISGNFVFSSPAIGADGTIYIGAETSTGGNPSYIVAISSLGVNQWIYTVTGGRPIRSSPAVGADGTVYVGTKASATADADFLALYSSGTLKWKYTVNTVHTTPDDIYSSPAIGSDGIIYFGAETGFLYALNPDGTVNWKTSAPNVSGINWSSPAIASDGTIYIGENNRYLYAFNSASLGLANSSWPKFHHDNSNTGKKTP